MVMKKARRKTTAILVLVLAAMFIAAAMAGCGSSPAPASVASTGAAAEQAASAAPATTQPPIVSDKPIEITMMINDNPTYPWNPDWLILNEIKKRTNVTINATAVPAMNYTDKFNLIMNTGNIPDLLVPSGDWYVYALNGKVLPVSDYMSQLPNMTAEMNKLNCAQEYQNTQLIDNKNYTLPVFTESQIYTCGLVVRKDIMTKLNLQDPKNFDDLYNVLVKMKEYDPKSYPMTGFYGCDMLFWFLGRSFNSFSIGGWSSLGEVTYDLTQEKYVSAMTSPTFQTILIYLNKLYKDGLLDPELFTQDVDQWTQKITTGKSFVAYDWTDQNSDINTAGKNTDPAFDFENVMDPIGPGVENNMYVNTNITSRFIMPSSVAEKPYFNELLKFADWLFYSDEGTTLSNWGVEGTTFQKDSNGKLAWAPNYTSSKEYQQKYGIGYHESLTGVIRTDYLKAILPAQLQPLQQQWDKLNWVPTMPTPKLTSDETDQVKLYQAPLQDYFNKAVMSFIMGKTDPTADWDSYVKGAQDKGIDKLVDIYNAALARQGKGK